MDSVTLIELLTGASAPTVLAVLLIWQLLRNKEISDGRVDDLKANTAIAEKNAIQMERLTDAISRQTEAISRLAEASGKR